MTNDTGDDIVGFIVGFFLGCCGITIAALFGRQRYLRGALAGYGVRVLVSVAIAAVSFAPVGVQRGSLNGGTIVRDVPWELVLGFVIVTVFGAALIGGAIWAFGGAGDDDDDDPEPPRSPEDFQYVTFSRD